MSFRRKPESRKILSMEEIRTVFWKDDSVVMIDQQALPLTERYVTCTDYREVIAAIKDLTVRGAPAIGVAAAMGIALGALHIEAETPAAFKEAFEEICQQFAASRPTARNLFWAIERMKRCFAAALPAGPETAADSAPGNGSKGTTAGTPGCVFPPPERCPRTDGPAPFPAPGDVHQHVIILKDNGNDPWRPIREALITEAIRIGDEDVAINQRLGMNGCELIPDGARILTHCNAGALATAGYGTALGVIRATCAKSKKIHVYVDETRPVLQGARLTAWELMREGIPCTLIADNMAGFLMQQGKVDLVIVGADRITANGDTANKIGTYALAVLARAHGIPFYVAAPLSTIDPSLPDGRAIPIEERNPSEVTSLGGVRTAPEGIPVWNPAFDVTPNHLITAIVTEAGILRPPFTEAIEQVCAPSHRPA